MLLPLLVRVMGLSALRQPQINSSKHVSVWKQHTNDKPVMALSSHKLCNEHIQHHKLPMHYP